MAFTWASLGVASASSTPLHRRRNRNLVGRRSLQTEQERAECIRQAFSPQKLNFTSLYMDILSFPIFSFSLSNKNIKY